jgi:hypothetical protein
MVIAAMDQPTWWGSKVAARFGDGGHAGKQATVVATSAINLGANIVAPELMPLASATLSGTAINDEFRTQQELLWQAVVAMLHALSRSERGHRLTAFGIARKHLQIRSVECTLVAGERGRRTLWHDLIW